MSLNVSIRLAFGCVGVLLFLCDASGATSCRVGSDGELIIQELEQKQKALLAQAKEKIATTPIEKRDPAYEQWLADIEADTQKAGPSNISWLCDTSSPAAKAYVARVDSRLEECGTQHFPKIGKRPVYGKGEVIFILDISGKIVDSKISKSSGVSFLDSHLLKVIDASAPFGDVPDDMRKDGSVEFRFSRAFESSRSQDLEVMHVEFKCNLKGQSGAKGSRTKLLKGIASGTGRP